MNQRKKKKKVLDTKSKPGSTIQEVPLKFENFKSLMRVNEFEFICINTKFFRSLIRNTTRKEFSQKG